MIRLKQNLLYIRHILSDNIPSHTFQRVPITFSYNAYEPKHSRKRNENIRKSKWFLILKVRSSRGDFPKKNDFIVGPNSKTIEPVITLLLPRAAVFRFFFFKKLALASHELSCNWIKTGVEKICEFIQNRYNKSRTVA